MFVYRASGGEIDEDEDARGMKRARTKSKLSGTRSTSAWGYDIRRSLTVNIRWKGSTKNWKTR